MRTAAGWHSRFRSSNGNVIVSSEVYRGSRCAVRAVELVTDAIILRPWHASGHIVGDDHTYVGRWIKVDER